MGDARCAAATMLAAVTAGLSVVREPRLVRAEMPKLVVTLRARDQGPGFVGKDGERVA